MAAEDDWIVGLLQSCSVWSARGARALDQYLARHPDVFITPDPFCPLPIVKLAAKLEVAGYEVARPVCSRCSKASITLTTMSDEGRVCGWCMAKGKVIQCVRCGKAGYPTGRRTGGCICRDCYAAERLTECVRCGKLRSPATRDENGSSLCNTCARPKHECGRCGQIGHASLVRDGQYICTQCYRRDEQPRRTCGGCGLTAPIAVRGAEPDDDRCVLCAERPRRRCSQCTKLSPVQAMWPAGPVCRACQRKAIRSPRKCDECQELGVIVARDPGGSSVCARCAGTKNGHTCRQCNRAGTQYFSGLCLSCSVRRRSVELLSGPSGARAEYAPLIDLLALDERAESSMRWLNNPSAIAALNHLSRVERAPTHADLDDLLVSKSVHYTRQLLVFTGVLPPRVEHLERIEPWLVSLLEAMPARHARVVGPFAHWGVLRHARRRAERREYTDGSAQHDRDTITMALRMLQWLDDEGCQVSDLNQSMVEEWVGGNARRASVTAVFIGWLRGQNMIGDLKIHQSTGKLPGTFPDPHDQAATIRKLLTEDDIDLRVRVAGVLVLLLGARVSLINRLVTSDVQVQGDRTYLALAKNPVMLPPVLGTLVRRLAKESEKKSRRNGVDEGPHFLFQSKSLNGAPFSRAGFAQMLRRQGVAPRIGRNGALLSLAQDLPPAVLAELLGMHVNSAMRWSRTAQRDWSEYLSARVDNDGRA